MSCISFVCLSHCIFLVCLLLLLQRAGEIGRIEAEDGSLTNADEVRYLAGEYSGIGYVDFRGEGVVWEEWTFDAPVGGSYSVLIRYSAIFDRPADFFMDGRPNPSATFSFSSTGPLPTWQTETRMIPLSQEYHNFKIVTSNSQGPNIDWIQITPGGVPEAVVLKPNNSLERGEFVFSPSGNYQVGLTFAGDLELQDNSSNTLWSAGLSGGNQCFMQGDGNMVVRDVNNKPLFSTNTINKKGAKFVVSDAGDAAILLDGVTLWRRGESVSPDMNIFERTDAVVLWPNDFLERNQFVKSPSGRYRVGLTPSGHFVLQDSSFTIIWSAGISGGERCFMQADGNLVIRGIDNSPLWDTCTTNNDGARLIVDNGGRIGVVHGSTPLWMNGLPRGIYQTPDASEDLQFPIRGAFYYAWYPETWDVNGEPPVRYKPELGLYNSGYPTVMKAHIDALDYAYVDLSIASWWGPDTSLDKARITLLMDETIAMESRLKWTVYHEDAFRDDPSTQRIKEDLDYLKKWFAWHPAWAHIDQRPVIFVYNVGGCEVADRWMQASGDEWYVVLKVFQGFKDCQTQPDR
jgi:hypothetical protein